LGNKTTPYSESMFLHCKIASLFAGLLLFNVSSPTLASDQSLARKRICINDGWKFFHYEETIQPDNLNYDLRPVVTEVRDDKPADSMPTTGDSLKTGFGVLKAWILPSGNDFVRDPQKKAIRPAGEPGLDFPFVQSDFDDSRWERVELPHDWAIKGPFYVGDRVPVGGGMGRLPVQGVAWYRREIKLSASDAGKHIYLDVDGAMSYAMVWLNGGLVGGWPYGYTSWQLDLTPYLNPNGKNQLAIRVDNPANSSRWYPGAGLYRNVWLTMTNELHVSHWGTTVQVKNVSKAMATIQMLVCLENVGNKSRPVSIRTDFFPIDSLGKVTGPAAATLETTQIRLNAHASDSLISSVVLRNPRLWGPPPTQTPNRYKAVTLVVESGKTIDRYETVFGIRDIRFDPEKGIIVNGEKIEIKGVNQHHDLGALGAAFNDRAAQRQLEMLREMGCNAIRMSHNPPAPELLDMTDRMGFLAIDEIFDCWQRKKTPLDFHLIFDDWHEQDLRAMIRRDKNHPSVILWSFGNEVGEQYTGEEGATLARKLYSIVKEEDATRPTTVAMNYAKPQMPLPGVVDVIGLNYQGEGIRYDGPYANLKGISTPPLFPEFHSEYPDKVILSTENASALSSRGSYMFPVYPGNSAPIRDGQGGNSKTHQVSSYDLYSVDFGSSADKVFATLENHPFVAGGFAWTGWDYIGEPTPYYSARSSYSGIIDLAGFKKDRYYLYQSHWRPEFPMVHLLPHWTWPDRIGQVTPVHVMTSGDEAELFLNGVSLGRKSKGSHEYRLRWDSVRYVPGTVKVVAYKNGQVWATDSVETAGDARKLQLTADRTVLNANGNDLSFITLQVEDAKGIVVPEAKNSITFSLEGPGEIVATDNGDATDLTAFPSVRRNAFNGYCLLIVRTKKGKAGTIRIFATSENLKGGSLLLKTIK
jgi:beta-galactosidase